MTQDELSYKTLELLRPDLLAQVVALAKTALPDAVLTLEGEPGALATGRCGGRGGGRNHIRSCNEQ